MMLTRFPGFFVLLMLSIQLVSAAPAEVEQLRYFASSKYHRIVFDVTSPVSYQLSTLDSPPRLVIDIINAKSVKSLSQPGVQKHRLIKQVRAGQHGNSGMRFVADLLQPATFKSFKLRPNKQYGHRLVVDIYRQKGLHFAAQSKPSTVAKRATVKPQATVTRQPQKQASKHVEKQVVAKKVEQKTETTLPQYHRKHDNIVVAIDAGHGGKDSGAIGLRKTREKDVVLAISKKLAALVDATPGMKSFLVRDRDTFVPLRERMKIARRAKADLFISIHADAHRNRKIKGSTVYTLSPGGAMREARVWANRSNQTELASGITLKDKDSVLASVLLDLSQAATLEASDIVASRIFTNLKKTGPVLRQKVMKKPYMVLKSPDIPSVLVETAFISNPYEEKQLRSRRFQSRIARSIHNGIKDYFATRQPQSIQLAAHTHKIVRGETLSEIAQQYGVSLRTIREANHLRGNTIRAGQILKIIPDV
ncbi:MAG: N-acetylmuramoyl-L-alanine amidase [Gammaproteobacteria bacterium]|nr:N-acetylmuramoyl-L-alanine amidase [Gammaproteobacteria bacterium]